MSTLKVTNIENPDGGGVSAKIADVGGGQLSNRNKIINGSMRIDQRNAGASVTPTANTYTVDRWICVITQSSKFSIQQNAGSVTPPAGFSNYLGVTSLSSYSVAASDVFSLSQVVEGYNVSDLAQGTSNAKSFTISFWVRSSLTGTFGGAISGGQIYPFSYTISSANTWEYKTITIPGSTAGTWNTTNGAGLTLRLSLGSGSTYSGTAGAWGSTDYYSTTGAVSVVGTNAATFYITGVQLEVGSVATTFEHRSFGDDLRGCQRYYQIFSTGGAGTATAGSQTNSAHCGVTFPVEMRDTPTITVGTASTSTNCTSFGAAAITKRGFLANATSSASGRQFWYIPTNIASKEL